MAHRFGELVIDVLAQAFLGQRDDGGNRNQRTAVHHGDILAAQIAETQQRAGIAVTSTPGLGSLCTKGV